MNTRLSDIDVFYDTCISQFLRLSKKRKFLNSTKLLKMTLASFSKFIAVPKEGKARCPIDSMQRLKPAPH
jgi:hypothetical protein